MGMVATKPHADGSSIGAFGWEGIHTTKYQVDPQKDLAVAFFSQVSSP